jgi:hypothetical protein
MCPYGTNESTCGNGLTVPIILNLYIYMEILVGFAFLVLYLHGNIQFNGKIDVSQSRAGL